MAEIVTAFLMPHDPLIAAEPDAAVPRQREAVMSAFAHIANRLSEEQIDTVITIGDDHYCLFGPGCVPRCLIAIGDVEGPIEDWLGIPREPIENHADLARHIMQAGFDAGIDWAVSKNLVVDHAAMIPVHYVVRPNPGIRTIPVYLNSGVEPLISTHRAHEIGRSIGEAVRSWPGHERIAVFGTGGISHWVGMAEMGRVNEEWDRKILDIASRGDVDALIAMSDEEILSEAGNGALEIKNWVCAMGSLPDHRAEVIAYEAIPQWICGCGFAELKAA